MREFIIGGLLFIWLVIVGLSTLDMFYTLLMFLYPLIIGFIALNIYLIKRIIITKINNQHKLVN